MVVLCLENQMNVLAIVLAIVRVIVRVLLCV